MATDTKPTSIKEKLREIESGLIAQGKITPDSSSAVSALGVPSFSEGTLPLDPNTGKPITGRAEQPAFEQGTVGAEVLGSDPAVSPSAPPQQVQQSQQSPAQQAQAPVPQPEAERREAGGEAAAQAAEQMLAQDDWDEFEFNEPDLETPIKIRAPKKYAETVKRGYGRRARYDRDIRRLGEAAPALLPLIESGQITQVLPMLQRAMADPQYGDYVMQGYQRAVAGLPLIEQARQQIAEQQAQQTQQYAPPAFEDPFLAEQLSPVLSQYEQRLNEMQAALSRQEQERRAAQAQQQQAQQQQQRIAYDVQAAHQDLAASMPEYFSGNLDADRRMLDRAVAYARDAGYAQQYGIRAGILFGAQRVVEMDRERAAATASPSAFALQQATLTNAARQEAASAAQMVGRGAPMQAPPPAPLPKPSTLGADGRPKPMSVYAAEMQRYLASQRR